MRIGGIQKYSLIDWPPKTVTTLFTNKCNFNCLWCQNKELFTKNSQNIDNEYLMGFFKENKNWIDGVCISGGEPLLEEDIEDFLIDLKKIGFPIKLDTNGSLPEKLRKIIKMELIDYVACDIKSPLTEKYSEVAGGFVEESLIKETIDILLLETNIDYEFRTTVVPTLLNEDDIIKISLSIKGAKRYYLQNFRPLYNLEKFSKIEPYSYKTMKKMAARAKEYVQIVEVRGSG